MNTFSCDAAALSEEIKKLKRKKNAIILAHYYQVDAIQEIADYVGDSLGLSQEAANTNADIIVFAGVVFMAETAKIINPGKKVLVPDIHAGCSLVDSCPPEKFKKFIEDHPGHTVISYINCSAEVKAMSDIICTSTNAVPIVKSVEKEKEIIFAPDTNLGNYVIKMTGREMLLWKGECEVHVNISLAKLHALRKQYPAAKLIVHPECRENILCEADFVGSTSALIAYAKSNPDPLFIVGTEAGILHKMRESVSGKKLIPAPATVDNECACSECSFMKMNTLEKLYDCLNNERPEVVVSEPVRVKAEKAIRRMLELSK